MIFEFPNIDPVAVAIGPLQIRWYALAYLAGFLLGWRYCMKLAGAPDKKRTRRPDAQDIDDFLPWVVLGVILGGRLGYVLFYNFEYYLAHPAHIPFIWEGGMSFHGGALGVIAVTLIYARKHKIDLLRLSDILAASVPIGLFFGRIANFINGELYGRVTDSPLGMVFPHGGPEPRHPSQLYEAFLEGMVLFIVLALMAQSEKIRNKPGVIAGTFLIGYGIFRAFIENFREPDAQLGFLAMGLTMGQVLCIPMVLGGGYLITRAVRKL